MGLMHDKPEQMNQPVTDPGRSLGELIDELEVVDPADSPDLVDAVANRIETDLEATGS
jgi:hypothetical protein